MGGKGRAAGPEPYVGMSPTQEFNARLGAASDFYTPAALRKPEDQATVASPAASTASDNQLGGSEVAAPSGPGIAGGSVTTTEDAGGAPPAAAMPTGDMMAQSITAPTTWSDQINRGRTRGDGSLELTGQV